MELMDLSHFLTNLELKNIPKIVKKTANLCILDSVGVAIGAKENPQIQKCCAIIWRYAEIKGALISGEPGSGCRYSPRFS